MNHKATNEEGIQADKKDFNMFFECRKYIKK